MKCIYCNQQCTPYMYEDGRRCVPCNVEYWYNPDYNYMNIRQPGGDYYNNHTPYVRMNLPPHNPRARIISSSDVLAEFNYIPNINPQNVQEKIKLFLLFS